MVYRPHIDDRLCFVLMPFRVPFNGYYELIIKKAITAVGMDALRADEIYGTRAIIRDIWDAIWRARIIIADVTDRNPNVNYELGLAHALGVPTILITKRLDDVPFDYQHRRCIEYDTEEAGWEQKLKTSLEKTISATLARPADDDELHWPYDTDLLKHAEMVISLESPHQIVLRGMAKVERLLASAYGPRGRNVSVALPNQGVVSHKQGLIIVNGTRSANPIEENGIEELRKVARHLADRIGDGTKLAMLLTQAIIQAGQTSLTQGHPLKEILSGMEQAIQASIHSITSASRPVKSEHLMSIARTAAGDRTLSSLVVEAMKKAGKDGIITVETGSGQETMLTVEEGLRFDRGYLSDKFITDPNTSECVLENCRILLWERKISTMREFLPVLEGISRNNQPLLVVADDIEGEALATLVVNKVRGVLQCAAVKAPYFGDRRVAMLQDMAILTGAKLPVEPIGASLEDIHVEDLGSAERVVVTKDETTILTGRGPSPAAKAHADSLRAAIDRTLDSFEREKLQERLARVAGGIARISIGGTTSIEIEERRYRTVSALFSARAAVEEGWSYGGGIALLNAKKAIAALSLGSEPERTGAEIVAMAFDRPFTALVETCAKSPVSMLSERQSLAVTHPELGFNAETCSLENMEMAGILDPTKTIRTALETALSFSRMILKTEHWDL